VGELRSILEMDENDENDREIERELERDPSDESGSSSPRSQKRRATIVPVDDMDTTQMQWLRSQYTRSTMLLYHRSMNKHAPFTTGARWTGSTRAPSEAVVQLKSWDQHSQISRLRYGRNDDEFL
jgi:hypothetical protein